MFFGIQANFFVFFLYLFLFLLVFHPPCRFSSIIYWAKAELEHILPSCCLLISVFLHSWNSSHCWLNCKHRAQASFFPPLMYCSSNPSEPPSSAAQSQFCFRKNCMTKRGFGLQVIYRSPLFLTAWPLKALSRINHFSSIFSFQVLFFLVFLFLGLMRWTLRPLDKTPAAVAVTTKGDIKITSFAPWIRASSTFMWCHISMNAESLPIA